jgi:ABC-type branched-subunit amino acid transport system substrate-binding protein
MKAIENAATAADGVPTRLAVAEAIRALTYAGITGALAFDSIGDLPVANYYIVNVNATSSADWSTNEVVATLSQASPGQ